MNKITASMLVITLFSVGLVQTAALREHQRLQQEWLDIERSYGIRTPQAEVDRVLRGHGRTGTQEQLNANRKKIHTLIKARPFDKIATQKQIREFEKLDPARWPRVKSYNAVADMIAAETPAAPAAPAAPGEVKRAAAAPATPAAPREVKQAAAGRALSPMEKHSELQRAFRNLLTKVGITVTDEVVNARTPIRGRQAEQTVINDSLEKLITLFSKTALTDDDIAAIDAEMRQYESYNPNRWPRTDDIRELRNLRI